MPAQCPKARDHSVLLTPFSLRAYPPLSEACGLSTTRALPAFRSSSTRNCCTALTRSRLCRLPNAKKSPRIDHYRTGPGLAFKYMEGSRRELHETRPWIQLRLGLRLVALMKIAVSSTCGE